MYDAETMRTLRMIQNADPDGFESEPTKADYEYFEKWAKGFGSRIWNIYIKSNWAERSDV
jgi:hypothetical protein